VGAQRTSLAPGSGLRPAAVLTLQRRLQEVLCRGAHIARSVGRDDEGGHALHELHRRKRVRIPLKGEEDLNLHLGKRFRCRDARHALAHELEGKRLPARLVLLRRDENARERRRLQLRAVHSNSRH
jgi:hypothetical protein